MKAVCWQGANKVGVENVPDPKILNPRDAIVKITTTAICGSDLHLYAGMIPTVQKGDIIGLTDEQVIFLTDIFPTGYMAAENCQIQEGDTVAIWGCGPIGQFAIRSALMLGAHRVGLVDKVPMGAFMNKGLTMKTGQTHIHKYLRPLLDRIQKGDIDPTFIITHVLPLEQAPHGYEIFQQKKDNCIKIVLKPGLN